MYRAQIVVDNGWSSTQPERPAPHSADTVDARIGEALIAPLAVSTRDALTALIVASTSAEEQAATTSLSTIGIEHGSDFIATLAILIEKDEIFNALLAEQWQPLEALRSVVRQHCAMIASEILAPQSSIGNYQRQRIEAVIPIIHSILGDLMSAIQWRGWIHAAQLQQLTESADEADDLFAQLEALGVAVVDERVLIHGDTNTSEWIVQSLLGHIPDALLRDSLALYLREIGQVGLLATWEERKLAEQIMEGVRAQDELDNDSPEYRQARILR